MLALILAVIWGIIELFIALGVIASVSAQSCAIIALAGFAIIFLVILVSGPEWPNWLRHS